MSIAGALLSNAFVFLVVAIVAGIAADTSVINRGRAARIVALLASALSIFLFIASAWASVLA